MKLDELVYISNFAVNAVILSPHRQHFDRPWSPSTHIQLSIFEDSNAHMAIDNFAKLKTRMTSYILTSYITLRLTKEQYFITLPVLKRKRIEITLRALRAFKFLGKHK